MAFPSVVYGEFGDEKETLSTKIGGLPLGTTMVLPDGREFVHCYTGGTAVVAGNLYQGAAGAVGSDAGYRGTIAVPAGSAAVGALTIPLTAAGTTAVTKDQFTDGVMVIASSVGTGVGLTYKIKANGAAAASGAFNVYLYESDPIVTALSGGTTTVALRENEYYSLNITAADSTGIGTLAGVAPNAAAASTYCWMQKKGRAGVKGDGTLVIGTSVTASSALAGAVAVYAGAAATAGVTKGTHFIGIVEAVAASLCFSTVQLLIP
jgi:hypothetical protein